MALVAEEILVVRFDPNGEKVMDWSMLPPRHVTDYMHFVALFCWLVMEWYHSVLG